VFEFSILRRYLQPKRKRMSLALIAIMSVFVISLVVWLLILFLSITEGIEKNWLGRLTSLNAPIRITPTEEYYRSYYHLIDEYAYASGYEKKTFHEKLTSKITDPYDETMDSELPLYVPKPIPNDRGGVLDLAKEVNKSLCSIPKQVAQVQFHDYQMAGALLRLTLARKAIDQPYSNIPVLHFLTQATYVNSIPLDKGPLHSLICEPTVFDINHLIYLADLGRISSTADIPEQEYSEESSLGERLFPILHNIHIQSFKTLDRFSLPQEVIEKPLIAYAKKSRGEIFYYVIPKTIESKGPDGDFVKGVIKKEGESLYFFENGSEEKDLVERSIPLLLGEHFSFTGTIDHLSLLEAASLTDILISAKISIQGEQYTTVVPWNQITIEKVEIEREFSHPPKNPPPWAYFVDNQLVLNQDGVLLPIHFKEQGCFIGDDGFFSFGKTSPLMVSEQRKKIMTVGFYDPGVINTGVRYILTSREIVNSISSKEESLVIDPLQANGFQVWFDDSLKASEVTAFLRNDFVARGIEPYFAVTPFYEYDFAKDLIGQFQSDRDLFMLVGVIILLVAICNIITLLLLLVHDKKAEIGIFLSLGASKLQISSIFAFAGVFLGGISTLIGSFLAYITLKNIDSLVWVLNRIEGRDAFNAAFYGSKLPNEFSVLAFTFILIATPLLSLGAGLIPAIKACKLRPSQILRSE
jgi:lipoprotein-releasing system permease protein